MIVTPCRTTVFAGLRELAVAAALGRQIDDHRAGRHAFHHLRGDQHRRLLAGNHRRRNHHVALRDDSAQQFALPAVESFVLRLARIRAHPAHPCASIGSSTKRPPRLCTCSFAAGRMS